MKVLRPPRTASYLRTAIVCLGVAAMLIVPAVNGAAQLPPPTPSPVAPGRWVPIRLSPSEVTPPPPANRTPHPPVPVAGPPANGVYAYWQPNQSVGFYQVDPCCSNSHVNATVWYTTFGSDNHTTALKQVTFKAPLVDLWRTLTNVITRQRPSVANTTIIAYRMRARTQAARHSGSKQLPSSRTRTTCTLAAFSRGISRSVRITRIASTRGCEER